MTAHHGPSPIWAVAGVIPDMKLRSNITAENISFIIDLLIVGNNNTKEGPPLPLVRV
jgi:hypothetical protein